MLGTAGGTLIGLVTGYFKGIVDNVVSRIMDALLALPLVIIAVVAITALGISDTTLVVVIGVIFAPLVGRTVRTAVLVERELDYVQAAKLRGERAPYVMFVEILPNVLAPILVEFTVRLGYAIFTVASLSFLGYGEQPPSPDWGAQVADNYSLLSFAWWTVLFPSLAIASLVIAVNLISDGLTQVVDQERSRAPSRAAPRPPPRRPLRSSCAISTSPTGCAAATARCCAASACASSAARASASSASRAAASRPRRWRSSATCRATAGCGADRCSSTAATSGASTAASCARCARAPSRWSTRTPARR